MKLTTKILDNFEHDKIIHFLVSLIATIVMAPLGKMWVNILMVALLFGVCYFKEKKLDDFYNPKDMKANLLGAGCGFLISTFWWLIL